MSQRRRVTEEINDLAGQVIGLAIDIHKELGPDLLESVYQKCLAYEFEANDIAYPKEPGLPVKYKSLVFDNAYRADFIIRDKIIIELKAVENVLPVHKAQLLSYLRLSGLELGLLINFNAPLLKNGITRIIN